MKKNGLIFLGTCCLLLIFFGMPADIYAMENAGATIENIKADMESAGTAARTAEITMDEESTGRAARTAETTTDEESAATAAGTAENIKAERESAGTAAGTAEIKTEDSQEKIMAGAVVKFKDYDRENPKLWSSNFIKWEFYDFSKTAKPTGHMTISYTLYVPQNFFTEAGSGFSIVHGAGLADKKYQWIGSVQNRGESRFEPTCNGNGGLAMLRWDEAESEQAAADYARCTKVGDFFRIKVKNAPLSACLDHDLSKDAASYGEVYFMPMISVYGIGVSGETVILVEDVCIKSGKKELVNIKACGLDGEDGTCYFGRRDVKKQLELMVFMEEVFKLDGAELNVKAGERRQMPLDEYSGCHLKFTSENTDIATVSNKGVVCGKKKGKALILVEYMGVTKKYRVRVK